MRELLFVSAMFWAAASCRHRRTTVSGATAGTATRSRRPAPAPGYDAPAPDPRHARAASRRRPRRSRPPAAPIRRRQRGAEHADDAGITPSTTRSRRTAPGTTIHRSAECSRHQRRATCRTPTATGSTPTTVHLDIDTSRSAGDVALRAAGCGRPLGLGTGHDVGPGLGAVAAPATAGSAGRRAATTTARTSPRPASRFVTARCSNTNVSHVAAQQQLRSVFRTTIVVHHARSGNQHGTTDGNQARTRTRSAGGPVRNHAGRRRGRRARPHRRSPPAQRVETAARLSGGPRTPQARRGGGRRYAAGAQAAEDSATRPTSSASSKSSAAAAGQQHHIRMRRPRLQQRQNAARDNAERSGSPISGARSSSSARPPRSSSTCRRSGAQGERG